MRKILLAFVMVAGLFSCSKEDWFEDIQPEINFFAVPEDATGEEADLRRDFFDGTGVYLLFSDTLGVREVPTLSGTAQNYQVVDLLWNMNSGGSYPDSLELFYYQDIAEKNAVAQLLQNDVLANLPELFHPYSVLLLDSLVRYTNSFGEFEAGQAINMLPAMQCLAISVGDISRLSPSEKANLQNSLMGGIVSYRISLIPDEVFDAFYSYSEEYYDIQPYSVPTPVQSVGFLEDTYTWTYSFNTRENDRKIYVDTIFAMTEEEFRATYSEYPVVINKMEEMVRILREYGVNIYE